MNVLRAVSALLLLACGACRSPWYDYSYVPVPQEARVVDPDVPGAQARVLVALNGIRRPKDDDPARVEGRLRVENLGSVPATVEREGLELVTADLRGVFLGRLVPDDQRTVAPGATAVFELRFDLPDGQDPSDHNFEGVAVKWTIDFEPPGNGVQTSAAFQRAVGYYDDPYLRPSIGIGFGYVHH